MAIDFMGSIGMKVIDMADVTSEAVRARDLDKARIDAFAEQALDKFLGFRIPGFGAKKRLEAALAMKNLARHPGTRLYEDMKTRADTYKVILVQKA